MWRSDLMRISIPEWFSFGCCGAGAAGGAVGEVGHGAADTGSARDSTGSSTLVPASAKKNQNTQSLFLWFWIFGFQVKFLDGPKAHDDFYR